MGFREGRRVEPHEPALILLARCAEAPMPTQQKLTSQLLAALLEAPTELLPGSSECARVGVAARVGVGGVEGGSLSLR